MTPPATNKLPLENLVIIDLDSGVEVYVQTLSIFVRRAIIEQAKLRFPDPDPALYQQKVEDAVEGFTIPLAEIPEYRKAMLEVLTERNQYANERVILYSVVGAPDKEALIQHFAPRLALMREDAILPADDWQAIILGCLVRTSRDINSILSVVNEYEVLEEAAITDAARLFRRKLPGPPNPRSDEGTQAPGSAGAVPPDP